MCDVATLAVGSMIAGAAGTGLSAIGQVQQGKAQATALRHQASIDERNAILARQRAEDALERAPEREADFREQGADVVRAQIQSLAANGIDIYGGTAPNIVNRTRGLIEADARTIRADAEEEAFGFKQQESDFLTSAALNRSRAKSVRRAGLVGAIGTTLSGAASLGAQAFEFQQAGAFKSKPREINPISRAYMTSPWAKPIGAF